jgi:hypothetical protein
MISTRIAAALLVALVSCDGGPGFDPETANITGAWSTRVENIGGPSGDAEPLVCTATWTMQIVAAPGDELPEHLSSEVPSDAWIECTDGYSSPFAHRGLDLLVLREGAEISFVLTNRPETFATATLSEDGRLRGRMSEFYYGGGDLTASRSHE